MNNLHLLFSTAFIILILLTSCRDPSLEQAIIDYNGSRWDQAYESIKKAVEKVPNDPEAWFYYGEIAGKKNQLQEMVDAFDKSLAIGDKYKTDITNEKNHYFAKYFNGGVQKYNSYIKLEDKQNDKAVEALKEIIQDFEYAIIIKKDYQANRLIAFCYSYIKDEENRLKYLKEATVVNPDTALSWLELGYYYREKKDYPNAIDNFKKAIEVDPQNTNALTMLAECLDFSGNKTEAIEAYKNAAEVNPQEKAIPFNLGLLFYKEANKEGVEDGERVSRLEESEIWFKKAYDIDPEVKDIYDLYGRVLLNNKKYNLAVEVLLEGTKYFPDAASIWSLLSIAYANLNEVEKANEAAKKAKSLDK